MKYKVLKSLITPILGLSAIGTIAITSTSCGNEQHSDEQPISEPRLDKSNLDLSVGNKEVINVLGLDNKEASVTWSSSDESLAIVQEESGNSTSIIANSEGKIGDVKITAAVDIAGNISELTCNVNVMIVSIKSIKIKPSVANISINGSLANFTIECTPTNASIQSVRIQSSNRRIANPISSGDKLTTFQVEGLNEGDATITAYVTDYNGKQESAKCAITVKASPVTSVELNKNELELPIGDFKQLIATVLPEDATNKEVTWTSSNDEVATVDQEGNVIGLSKGTVTITVATADGNHKATCEVTVKEIQVASVELNKNELELALNHSEQLKATVYPEKATNKEVIWSSSDDSIATVDQEGNVKGVNNGEATITVTTKDGGFNATCTVTVKEFHVTGIELDKRNLNLPINGTEQLIATILPKNASNKELIWEIGDEEIATIVNNEKVLGIKKGKTTITVKSKENPEIKATCMVNVYIPAKSIKLDAGSLQIHVGSSIQLNATVLPENAFNKNVTWVSDNNDVATVDQNGKVVGVSIGDTIITAYVEDYYSGEQIKSTCKVTVEKTSVKSVELNKSELQLKVGSSEQLTTTVLPENATNKEVTWSTNDDGVATVSQDGNITGIKRGQATITVRSKENLDIKATCKVVVYIPVASVELDKNKLNLPVSGSEQLVATITPEDATNQNVTWSSSVSSVATVDNGKVTAIKEGSTTIIVTTEDGKFIAKCEVYVYVPVEGFSVGRVVDGQIFELFNPKKLIDDSNICFIGNSIQLALKFDPFNASYDEIIWSSLDDNATITKNGLITFNSKGVSKIHIEVKTKYSPNSFEVDLQFMVK